jgi:hypothetical protein
MRDQIHVAAGLGIYQGSHRMNQTVYLSLCLMIVACQHSLEQSRTLTDESETVMAHPVDSVMLTYELQMQTWFSPEDVSKWIAENFTYDRQRALLLSETNRATNHNTTIFTPPELYDRRAGVCIDLARFGVETLRHINPNITPKYLMITFEPIEIDGQILRRHWLTTFQRNGSYFFMADSKRPGHIAGPFKDVESFINTYENYRGRKIVTFALLDTYQKTKTQNRHH